MSDNYDPLAASIAPRWYQWAQDSDPLGDYGAGSYSSWAPQSMYSYGNQSVSGIDYAPSFTGEYWSPLSVQFGTKSLYDQDFQSWIMENNPELFIYQGGGSVENTGQVGNPNDPSWSAVNAWNNDIVNAARQVQQETGIYVPPNVIKAIMKIESGGLFNTGQGAESPHGARGLMQVTDSTMGNYDYGRLLTDAAYGIYAGTMELALRYQDMKSQMPEGGWSNAAVGYFSGHYVPFGSDDGFNTDFQYQDAFESNLKALDAARGMTGGPGAGTGIPGGGGAGPTPVGMKAFNAIWGGFDAPISQEYGLTDFSLGAGAGMYGYSSEYTTDGSYGGHIGIDVGIQAGTALYSPVGGTVVCAGTDNGNGMDSCAAFTSNVYDQSNPRRNGRFEVMLDNGDVLIFGHMKSITVNPGDRLSPGAFVGYSGNQNGDHVHVEYRQKNSQCRAGYCAIDPREALSGNFAGSLGSPGASQGELGVAGSPATSWADYMKAAAMGVPLGGQFIGGGGWNQELRRLMGLAPGGEPASQPGWAWGSDFTPIVTAPPVTSGSGVAEP